MMDTASAPLTSGGVGSLLARLSRLVLPGLVLVMPLVLFRFLLLVVFVFGLFLARLILAGLLARFLLRPLARLLLGLFQAGFVHTGLLTGFALTVVFVVGGVFLLPLTGV